MKKILVSLLAIFAITLQVSAATTWVAKNRVTTVGKQLLTKNAITAKLTFKVVDGTADNSTASSTKVVNISSDELQYAGNDSEVAAAISNELGHIICCHADKSRLLNYVLNGSGAQNAVSSSDTASAGADYLSSKFSEKETEEADITGVNLMIKAGYNPLAMIVWITKQPGSALDIIKSQPNNFDRAMATYKYLYYAYPQKVKAGYSCQEYKIFLISADKQMKKLTKNKRKLSKFKKEQAKMIQEYQMNLQKYKTNGGLNGWGVTYDLLTTPADDTTNSTSK